MGKRWARKRAGKQWGVTAGGGSVAKYYEWVALDLTAAKWAAIGGNVTNNWTVTNVGSKMVITAGITNLVQKKCEKSGTAGNNHNDGLALVHKAHIDCTPAGAPSGVTADTFWSEYAIVGIKMQFGQLGAAGQTSCGYGIGGSEAVNADPWGTSGTKGTRTRCGVGFASYSASQSGNPTVLPLGTTLNNFANVVRVEKTHNQANGKCKVTILTLGPNDGATPALFANGQAGNTSIKADSNFAWASSLLLREGTGDTDDVDTLAMQLGGYPTTSLAGIAAADDSNHEGVITCWVENSANDAALPVKAKGPQFVTMNHTTDHMRYLGGYMHPMVLIDQVAGANYSGTEKGQVVIESIQVLVQPIRGRKSF